jgi:hypothetical protein
MVSYEQARLEVKAARVDIAGKKLMPAPHPQTVDPGRTLDESGRLGCSSS